MKLSCYLIESHNWNDNLIKIITFRIHMEISKLLIDKKNR